MQYSAPTTDQIANEVMELVIPKNHNSKEDSDLTYNSVKKCFV